MMGNAGESVRDVYARVCCHAHAICTRGGRTFRFWRNELLRLRCDTKWDASNCERDARTCGVLRLFMLDSTGCTTRTLCVYDNHGTRHRAHKSEHSFSGAEILLLLCVRVCVFYINAERQTYYHNNHQLSE